MYELELKKRDISAAISGLYARTDENDTTASSASGSDLESASAQQSDSPSSASPKALHVEHNQPIRTSGCKPDCAGTPCRQGLGCPRHPNLTKILGRHWEAKELRAKANNLFHPPPLPGSCSNLARPSSC